MYYITPDNLKDEIKIRNSHFISLSYSVEDLKNVKKILSEMQNRFSDANHICYAYRICNLQQLDLFYNPEIIEYATDDGEPSGTAGRQILNVIKNNSLIMLESGAQEDEDVNFSLLDRRRIGKTFISFYQFSH